MSVLLNLPLSLRTKSLDVLPQIAKPLVKRAPFALKKAVLLPAIKSIFKEALEDGDFEFLEGKWLAINVEDIGFEFWISFANEQLVIAEPMADDVKDASFKANSEDLILIAGRKQDPDTLFFKRRLVIEGDTELGLEVKNLIDSVDLDSLPSNLHKAVQAVAEMVEDTRQQQVAAVG